MNFVYLLTDNTLTVVLNNVPHVITHNHNNFDAVIAALSDPNTNQDDLERLLDIGKAVNSFFTSGRIKVENGIVFFDGREITGSITRRILEFVNTGRPELAEPLCRFLERVQNNPSYRAVSGLYDWVLASKMPLTPEGKIIAWKIVRGDYLDYYSGTLDHSLGKVVELPRNQCNEDPDQTCSYGIHFCSYEYLPAYHSGDSSRRIMMVEIDPADVVAIPRDYNTAKGRCCRLTVVGEVPEDQVKSIFPDEYVYYGENYSWEDEDEDEDVWGWND